MSPVALQNKFWGLFISKYEQGFHKLYFTS